jgi:lipoate-protein ligase B
MDLLKQRKCVLVKSRSLSIDSCSSELTFIDLGLTSYQAVWQMQKDLQRKLIEGTGAQTVLFCEHNPVITLGKGAKASNLLVSEETLARQGVELFQIERGGDITFHGPGQLVVYPILNLNAYKRDVSWYMRTLEGCIISVLADCGIEGTQIEGKTGVWIKERKIASIGVRLSRWCSMHGLSMNVLSELSGYQLINPCGFNDIEMTSMMLENPSLKEATIMDDVKKLMQAQLTERFKDNL